MRKIQLLLIIQILFLNLSAQQVGIGTNSPDTSAVLDIQSTTAGLLIPRMTTVQRTNIYQPKQGLLVFDLTTNSFWYFDGTSWGDLSSSSSSLDEAYNNGGAGLGKTIDAVDGAVQINGEDGLYVTGSFNSGSGVEFSGAGTRMFFNPKKAAFRAGRVFGANWDGGNIGNYSFVVGNNSEASGEAAVAMGRDNEASGFYTTALGRATTAEGSSSTSIGNNTIANAYASTAIGFYNDPIVAKETSMQSETPLFIVGNGTNNANRSNAFVVKNSGEVNINDEYSLPTIDGNTNQVLSTDGLGQISWIDMANQDFRVPFYSKADFDTISSPEDGEILYITDEDETLMWNGANWIVLSDNCYGSIESAFAGTDQDFILDALSNDTTFNLNGNTPINGEGVWSFWYGNGGVIADTTDPNSSFTGLNCENYGLFWTVTSNCGVRTDYVRYNIESNTPITNPDVGNYYNYIHSDDTVFQLNANTPLYGIGTWSLDNSSSYDTVGVFSNVNDPNATFTGITCGNYRLIWTIDNGCISYSDNLNLIFRGFSPSTANAGNNQYIYTNDTVTNLLANAPTVGTGEWSIVSGSGGFFGDINNSTTTFTGSRCSYYTLKWTISNHCNNISSDEVFINFRGESPTNANAGSDIYSPSSTVVTLAANTPVIGVGTWSVSSGTGGSFSNINDPNATFTGQNNKKYILEWTINTLCEDEEDEVKVFLGNVIGQYAYGGIIAFVEQNGLHGIVISEVGQGSLNWGCYGTIITGADGLLLGEGQQNTIDIIGDCSTVNIAAKVCDDLVLNGYTDWYLPSKGDFDAITNIGTSDINATIGNVAGYANGLVYNSNYWTSSEYNNNLSYVHSSSSSLSALDDKDDYNYVRAIRSF